MHVPEQPDAYAWLGAARFTRDLVRQHGMNGLTTFMVSKQEYMENGHHYCNRKFDCINIL